MDELTLVFPLDIKTSLDQWRLPDLTKESARGTEFWRIIFKHSFFEITHGLINGKHIVDTIKVEINLSGRTLIDQAFLEAKQRFKEKISSGYNVPGTGTQSTIKEPMCAKKFQDECTKISYPVGIQPKLDGVRCRANFVASQNGEITFISRNNKKNYKLPHLIEPIRTLLSLLSLHEIELDGELYSSDIKFNILSGLLRKEKNITPEDSEKISTIKYIVFDIIGLTLPYKERIQILLNATNELNSSKIIGLGYCIAISKEMCDLYMKWFVDDGYEGAMIRDLDAPYKMGRSHKYLLKYKLFEDSEFKIVNMSAATGTHEGAIIFECEISSNAKTFTVTPNWTIEERKKAYIDRQSYIGKWLTVKYQNLSDDGIPRFPKGISIREE